MSYILEALKKAEAERKGGVAQGIQILPPISSTYRDRPAWRRPLPWAALAALAIALASAAWFAVTRSAKETAAPAPVRAQPAPPPVAPPVQAQAAPAPKPKEKIVKKPAEVKPQPAEEPKIAKTQPAEQPVPLLQELPEQVQREIPPLAVGGYIYSGSKADRSVLINQRLLHEGEEVAPGLVLEKMLPNGMVLNYRGYRYRTGY
ncbi:hypothetical protein EGT07_21380 [Herbaspirillum sp. HC18]|nr:hypothetical protein EGT07_21380 [Herbaspirillum sp. HC18]